MEGQKERGCRGTGWGRGGDKEAGREKGGT